MTGGEEGSARDGTGAAADAFHDPARSHAAYQHVMEGVGLLVGGTSAGTVAVPACPGWTVRDLVGHLVHVGESFAALEESQIDLRPHEGIGLPSLLDRWSTLDGPLRAAMGRAPELRRRILLLDAFSHEADLRVGLGVPAPPEGHPAFADALDLATMGFGLAVHAARLPALRIDTRVRDWVVGEGTPAATLSGSGYEVFRSLTGRRTWEQVESLDWSGAGPVTWAGAFTWGPFAPPPVEREPARSTG